MLRLCCLRPGSPGQLGYHVMEKIAIFSSGSLTYLSPLSDTALPSTPTYPATQPPRFLLSPPLPPFAPGLYLLLTHQQWVFPILLTIHFQLTLRGRSRRFTMLRLQKTKQSHTANASFMRSIVALGILHRTACIECVCQCTHCHVVHVMWCIQSSHLN